MPSSWRMTIAVLACEKYSYRSRDGVARSADEAAHAPHALRGEPGRPDNLLHVLFASTFGTWMPPAPISSTSPMRRGMSSLTRTTGRRPDTSAARIRFCRDSTLFGPCSRSSTTKSNPAKPIISTKAGSVDLENGPSTVPFAELCPETLYLRGDHISPLFREMKSCFNSKNYMVSPGACQ